MESDRFSDVEMAVAVTELSKNLARFPIGIQSTDQSLIEFELDLF